MEFNACHHLAADCLGGAFRLAVAAQVDGDVRHLRDESSFSFSDQFQ